MWRSTVPSQYSYPTNNGLNNNYIDPILHKNNSNFRNNPRQEAPQPGPRTIYGSDKNVNMRGANAVPNGRPVSVLMRRPPDEGAAGRNRPASWAAPPVEREFGGGRVKSYDDANLESVSVLHAPYLIIINQLIFGIIEMQIFG